MAAQYSILGREPQIKMPENKKACFTLWMPFLSFEQLRGLSSAKNYYGMVQGSWHNTRTHAHTRLMALCPGLPG